MYEDKTLICKECGAEFVFTAGEQEFYASKGFVNEPRDARPAAMRARMLQSLSAKCSPPSARAVARKQEFPLSPVKTVLYIAASALQR